MLHWIEKLELVLCYNFDMKIKSTKTPFSKNIVFLDTEFSTLDPYKGEILSVGIIKLSGEELYIELEYDGPVSGWVKKNIIPTLKGPKISRKKAKTIIKKFIGNKKPYMVSYVNQFDAIYFYKLFGVENQPCYWIPIDFASMMFGYGKNPEKLLELAKKLKIKSSKYTLHNALDDARLLRDIYIKFFK